MKKLNMTIGRFQPFTQGHLNMVNDGKDSCIVYQIKIEDFPKSIDDFKIKGKKVKKSEIKHVISYLNGEDIKLTETEIEILKRPFSNELVSKELELVDKESKRIIDVVYVKNFFDALDRFNKFCTDNKDTYEPQYLMCGDDRESFYSKFIDKYDELETELNNGEKIPNILKGKLKTNIGNGRTEGISGTELRKSIINNDKSKFSSIMPKGVASMFDEFKQAFDNYKSFLEGIIKEWKTTTLKNYILESIE